MRKRKKTDDWLIKMSHIRCPYKKKGNCNETGTHCQYDLCLLKVYT